MSVQRLMLDAGFEPPFTSAPAKGVPQPERATLGEMTVKAILETIAPDIRAAHRQAALDCAAACEAFFDAGVGDACADACRAIAERGAQPQESGK